MQVAVAAEQEARGQTIPQELEAAEAQVYHPRLQVPQSLGLEAVRGLEITQMVPLVLAAEGRSTPLALIILEAGAAVQRLL